MKLLTSLLGTLVCAENVYERAKRHDVVFDEANDGNVADPGDDIRYLLYNLEMNSV